MKNVVLIGFMGTGKTSTGRLLASRMGYSFVDTDRKIEKECQFCGKSFQADIREVNRGNAKYCSLSCAAKAPKSLQYEQVCKQCGQKFMSSSKNTKYCSDSCKQKNYRARQKSLSENGTSIKNYYKIFENIPCELCQWDKTTRDLHHIIEVSNGGTNELYTRTNY